jgi:hypothetical protein
MAWRKLTYLQDYDYWSWWCRKYLHNVDIRGHLRRYVCLFNRGGRRRQCSHEDHKRRWRCWLDHHERRWRYLYYDCLGRLKYCQQDLYRWWWGCVDHCQRGKWCFELCDVKSSGSYEYSFAWSCCWYCWPCWHDDCFVIISMMMDIIGVGSWCSVG